MYKPQGSPYSSKVSELEKGHPESTTPDWPSTRNTIVFQQIQVLEMRSDVDPSICRNALALPLLGLQAFDS